MLDFYSQFNPSPLSIKQFIDFGESNDREKERETEQERKDRKRESERKKERMRRNERWRELAYWHTLHLPLCEAASNFSYLLRVFHGERTSPQGDANRSNDDLETASCRFQGRFGNSNDPRASHCV